MNKIAMEAIGISPSADQSRPVMIFREKEGERVLPVWMEPVDAGLILAQSQVSPHQLSHQILSSLGVRVTSCTFDRVVGHHQFAEIQFEGSENLKNIRARADHVVSFCLLAKCEFYTTSEVLMKSREVDGEMGRVASVLRSVQQAVRAPNQYLN